MGSNSGRHSVAEATGQFTNKFLKVIANDNSGNLITSPLSAQVVLAMAAYGARGTTATQMRSALGIPSDDELGQSGYQSLIETLNAVKGVELRLANRIYTATQFEVKSAYKKLTATKFLSSSQEVDFNNAEAAANTINTWCEEQTNKRIKDVINPDSLNSDTRLVLVNAVYFKGQWEKKFNPELTEDRPFHIDEQIVKNVPTMFMRKKFKLGDLPELNSKFIELPYQGNRLSMIIILPNEVNGLKTVEDNLHKVNLSQAVQQAHLQDVELSFPKFKIECSLQLNDYLQKLGMTEMFKDAADFSGIADIPLKVSKVVQKAFIVVNEEGSEAGAASGMMIQARCMVYATEVLIDRPFIFEIVSWTHGSTNEEVHMVPLFTGHVIDPSL